MTDFIGRRQAPFIGRLFWYSRNLRGSRQTYAAKAFTETPNGTAPAVGLFRDRHLLVLLTPEDAIRVANGLNDAVEAHDTERQPIA